MINIVVVCWNAVLYTEKTLQSLVKTLIREKNIQLTIIDNGSIDETDCYLNTFVAENPRMGIKIIKNDINVGIGAAYNQGLAESIRIDAKYTVFCNNDLLFTSRWLKKMKRIMDKNLSIAMLSPIVPSAYNFYDKNRSIREVLLQLKNSDSPDTEITEFIGIYKNMKRFVNHISYINKRKYGAGLRIIKFPNAVSSCVIMTRTSVFSDIGFFANPLFKAYGGEDIDMCWHVLKRGFDIAITSDVYVHHFRGKSIKAANLDRIKLLKESNKKLFDIWKDEIIYFLKKQGINRIEDIPNIPENWLLNELIKDIDLVGVLNER